MLQPRVIIPGFPSVRSMAMRWASTLPRRARLAFENVKKLYNSRISRTRRNVSVFPQSCSMTRKERETSFQPGIVLLFSLSLSRSLSPLDPQPFIPCLRFSFVGFGSFSNAPPRTHLEPLFHFVCSFHRAGRFDRVTRAEYWRNDDGEQFTRTSAL